MCRDEPDTRAEHVRSAPSTPADLARELTRYPAGLLVIEAYSQAGWVHDLREELSRPALVAGTTGAA